MGAPEGERHRRMAAAALGGLDRLDQRHGAASDVARQEDEAIVAGGERDRRVGLDLGRGERIALGVLQAGPPEETRAESADPVDALAGDRDLPGDPLVGGEPGARRARQLEHPAVGERRLRQAHREMAGALPDRGDGDLVVALAQIARDAEVASDAVARFAGEAGLGAGAQRALGREQAGRLDVVERRLARRESEGAGGEPREVEGHRVRDVERREFRDRRQSLRRHHRQRRARELRRGDELEARRDAARAAVGDVHGTRRRLDRDLARAGGPRRAAREGEAGALAALAVELQDAGARDGHR